MCETHGFKSVLSLNYYFYCSLMLFALHVHVIVRYHCPTSAPEPHFSKVE